jgi:hypothetical protein
MKTFNFISNEKNEKNKKITKIIYHHFNINRKYHVL